MADRAIDYDRPTIIKTDNGSNMDVFMYKDDPGVYLNAFGKPVPESIAEKAGFDIARYSKQRIRKQRLAAASAAVNAELDLDEEDFRKPTTVATFGNYLVVKLGDSNRFCVRDVDGNNLTPNAVLSQTAAVNIATEMGKADGSYMPPADPAVLKSEVNDADVLATADNGSGQRNRPANRRSGSGPGSD